MSYYTKMNNYVKIEEPLKKQFDLLFRFLSKIDDKDNDGVVYERLGYSKHLESNYEDDVFWFNGKQIPMVGNLVKLFEDIFQTYFDKYLARFAGNDYDEYYEVKFICLPSKKQILIRMSNYERTEEGYSSVVNMSNLNDERENIIKTFMSDNNCTNLTINFEGYGDDGYINEKGINQDGNTIELNGQVHDEFYTILYNEYGGYENNEGGEGSMVIDVTEDRILFNISYYGRELEDVGLNLFITE